MAAAVSLSPAQQAEVRSRLAEFQSSWTDQALASQVKALPPAGDPLRLALLHGMVAIDLARQWQQGRRPTVEGFLHFYPELGTRDSVAVELIHAEYRAREQYGGGANLADFRRRFPNQADALQKSCGPAKETAPAKPAAASTPTKPAAPVAPASTPAASAPAAAKSATPDKPLKLDKLPVALGRYLVQQELGRGGMGVVYRAEDQESKRTVALKVLHEDAEAEGSADKLQRFLREGRLAATLKHPHLNPVLDVGHEQGRHFLAMQFVEGRTLAEGLRRGPMDPKQAVELVRTLAQALESAHSQGIIHRDLKPANIMIDAAGRPIVMDFGLARRASDVRATVNGQMLGTPSYMPPEQVMGDVEGMGPACDIYSLGVILYECVTGKPPFQGDLGTIMLSVVKKPPTPPTQVKKGLDPRLDSLCLRAMAKDPEHRFGSMADFAAALTSFLEGRAVPPPVLEVSPSRVGPMLDARRRPPRRRSRGRWPMMAGIGAVLLAVLGLVGWLVVGAFTPRGTIRIEVDDPAATVLINGQETPMTRGKSEMLTLAPGSYQLVVRRGDREEEQDLVVRAGKNKSFRAKLPPREPPPPPPEEKWVAIFNGKDLAGWHRLNAEPIMFRATNEGVLAAFGPGPGWLLTDQTFGDFELRLEYRLTQRSASGVALRAANTGSPSTTGVEIQLIDHSHFPRVAPLEQNGSLLNAAAPITVTGHGVGVWHKLHIVCWKSRMHATIDNTLVLNLELDSMRNFYREVPGLQSRKGHIGLEAQDGVVSFRNIEVKELFTDPGRPKTTK